MSAGFATDCPRHAWITWFASNRVIPALAIRLTDRVNGRKIYDIEAHGFRIVDARQAITERRAAVAVSLCGPWEEFIPRSEHRRRPIDDNTNTWSVLCRVGAVRVRRH